MLEFFQPVLDVFASVLEFLHDLVEPLFGVHSWGWSIIGLTLIVRILLLPLAIKQTRSMKAMQQLQPQIKAIQEKYKTDREMMRKDPDKYRARKQKQQQEMMALYQQEGANPAASCLPLLAQAPVFLALFWTLNGNPDLTGAPFYFITSVTEGGLEKVVSSAGWPGWMLIVLMSGTMFFSQKQMMARNAATMVDNPMAQQQKILLYVMPLFLAAVSFQFPLGILLYWVTTNLWQILQQAIVLREGQKIDAVAEQRATSSGASGTGAAPAGPARGATSGRKRSWEEVRREREAKDAGTDADGDTDTPAEKSSNSAPDDDRSGSDEPAAATAEGDEQDAPSPARRSRLPRRSTPDGTA